MTGSQANRYAKGEATKRLLLDAALKCFSRAPFGEVSTRTIASEAGLNLPAIKYYFGDKQGLYEACSTEVVRAYEAGLLEARHALPDATAGPKAQLKALFHTLTRLTTDRRFGRHHTGFILYALQREDEAQRILIDELWAPGLAAIAGLIAQIRGRLQPDDTDRLDAVMLLASLSGFTTGLPVSLRVLGWSQIDQPQQNQIIANITAQIDRL